MVYRWGGSWSLSAPQASVNPKLPHRTRTDPRFVPYKRAMVPPPSGKCRSSGEVVVSVVILSVVDLLLGRLSPAKGFCCSKDTCCALSECICS